jgi:putative methyltransferase (TIGR04325 family)
MEHSLLRSRNKPMSPSSKRRMAASLERLPGVRQMRERAHLRTFVSNREDNLFLGMYQSFEDAAAHAPAAKPTGYDNEGSAQIAYGNRVMFYDYPAMLWISRSLQAGMRSVFDLGGHVGIKYYAFRKPLDFPADLRWTVCDVPAVVAQGRQQAQTQDPEQRLSFVDDYHAMSGHDVLFASGSLQYLPQRLGDMLNELAVKPRRIVLNITAVHPDTSYYTLNSIGTAFCPYRVQSHGQLVKEISACGYTRRDSWENIGKVLRLPMHPELDLEYYSGYCFDRV